MNTQPNEHSQLEDIDALTGRSSRKLFSLSPNDVLVQISLPLVLILAIATRLMMIAQSMSTVDQGPVILDLWKQQLILRVEHVLQDWEKSSGLAELPDFSRVHWQGQFPNDPVFSKLCTAGHELSDINALKLKLYRAALNYTPPDSTAQSEFKFIQTLYDPQEAPPGQDPATVPEEFRITPERRAYALDYIGERCLSWQSQLEEMQWAMIDKVAAEMSPDSSLADKDLATQMRKIADALKQHGYPLLPTIADEYGDTHE